MAKWIKPLSQVASKSAASRNLKDEEVVQALMAQAGVQDKVQKPTFLENLSAALGAFEWSDDALKSMQEESGVGGFLGSYLLDIPRTLAGVALGKRDWVDPDEGHGVELMKYLGIENKPAQYILGTAADIFEPSMAVSSALKTGTKLTETGASFADDLAKAYAGQGAKGAAKKLGTEFGENAAKSALKRMELGEDALSIANDYLVKQGAKKGLVETIEPGLYLGTSAKNGKLIAKGTIPSYIGKMIENPLLAPIEVGANAFVKTGLDQTKVVSKVIKKFDDSFLKRFDFQHELKKIGEPTLTRLGSKAHGINVASEYAASEAVKDLQKTFEGLPKEQVAKLIDIDRRRIVESAAGLPQKTTVERVLKNLSNSALTKKEYEEIVGRMSKEMKETPLEVVGKIMDEGQKISTTGPTGQLIQEGFEPLNLEQVFGTKAYNLIKEQWEEAKNYTRAWDELAQEIGYKGGGVIKSFPGFGTKTGMSNIDRYLDPNAVGIWEGEKIPISEYLEKAKGRAVKRVVMSPDEYLAEAAKLSGSDSVEKFIKFADDKNVGKYAEMMRTGTKMDVPYLDYAASGQEGRNRALAAKLLGYKEIPVIVEYSIKNPPENILAKELKPRAERFVETLDDVESFKDAVKNSNLDEASKEYYLKFVANTMEENIKNLPHREALGLGSFGAGYVPHVFNMEQAKELPDEGLFKRNLVDTKNRTFSTGVDVAMFNKYSPYKLEFETGASGLVKQIGHEAGQREAVKRVHDMYSVLGEQVQQGLMPRFGMEWQKGIPKYWKKTGVPMLDEMGVVVDPKVWNTIKDANKFLIGKQSFDDTLRLMNKLNSAWRGWTTAMTLNIKGKELPVNPAYYVRNWMNNKLSAVLYGGIDPLVLPTRNYQATKVWKYIETGEGGDEAIGHLKVKDIAKDFIDNGGLGGTNIDDIRQGMEINKTIGDKLSRVTGSGDLARKIETTDKIMVFLDQKLKNVDNIAAMDKVRFSLFDYTQLTDFEKDTVKPLFAFYCVPESAEILTRDGWKTHDQLRLGEEVLSYNRKKKAMEWTPLRGVATFEHDQELYEFKNKRYSFMFTDEHKWIAKRQKTFTKGKWYGGKESLKKANRLTTGDSIRVLAPYVPSGESLLTPEQARLLGWCLTDGYIRIRKNIIRRDSVSVTLCQHPKKFLREVIEIAGGNISKPHPTSGTVYIEVKKERLEPIREYLLDKSKLPGLVTRLSKEALKAMFDAMYKADGTVKRHRGSRDSLFFAAQKEEERELFRLIATLLGYRTSSSNRGSYLSKKQYIEVGYNLKRKHYKGIVWCPQTDNKTWVMRQNGFITITGNTWNKKNFVSFFKTLSEDPNRIKIFDDIFKGFKQLADEQDTDIKEILPDYLRGAYSVITGGGEQVGALYGFGTNVEAAGELFGRDMKESAQNLFGQLAPNIRIPLELVADFNFFKGKPISEDTSAYSMRNLPDNIKELMGIQASTFKNEKGEEVTTYKMNPTVKYLIENFRPATSLLKLFNIATDEGVDNEMFLDLLNYITGIRYQQYDTDYLRRQMENEKYKQRMQMLMDAGYVNEYKNYYIPKSEK